MNNVEKQLRQQLEWKEEEASKLEAELQNEEANRERWKSELPLSRASVAARGGKYSQSGLDLIEQYARDSLQHCQRLSKGLKVKQKKLAELRARLEKSSC